MNSITLERSCLYQKICCVLSSCSRCDFRNTTPQIQSILTLPNHSSLSTLHNSSGNSQRRDEDFHKRVVGAQLDPPKIPFNFFFFLNFSPLFDLFLSFSFSPFTLYTMDVLSPPLRFFLRSICFPTLLSFSIISPPHLRFPLSSAATSDPVRPTALPSLDLSPLSPPSLPFDFFCAPFEVFGRYLILCQVRQLFLILKDSDR